jgi:hypothetical protein
MKVMILALILLLAILLSASSGSLVAGTRVDKQTKRGILIPVYFETASGPSRSIPLTNTAQTPQSIGHFTSFQVPPGFYTRK